MKDRQLLNWLDKAIEQQGSDLRYIVDTDYYDKIKSDPRWRRLRARHGYSNDPIEHVEIEITPPPGISVDKT